MDLPPSATQYPAASWHWTLTPLPLEDPFEVFHMNRVVLIATGCLRFLVCLPQQECPLAMT